MLVSSNSWKIPLLCCAAVSTIISGPIFANDARSKSEQKSQQDDLKDAASSASGGVVLSPCLVTVPVKPSPWVAIKNICSYPVSAQFKFNPNVVKTFSFARNEQREGSFSREPFTFLHEVRYRQPNTTADSKFIKFTYPYGKPGGYRVDILNSSDLYIDLKFSVPINGSTGYYHIMAKPGLNQQAALVEAQNQEVIEWAETEPF
jgi:hypothetical protein